MLTFLRNDKMVEKGNIKGLPGVRGGVGESVGLGYNGVALNVPSVHCLKLEGGLCGDGIVLSFLIVLMVVGACT